MMCTLCRALCYGVLRYLLMYSTGLGCYVVSCRCLVYNRRRALSLPVNVPVPVHVHVPVRAAKPGYELCTKSSFK